MIFANNAVEVAKRKSRISPGLSSSICSMVSKQNLLKGNKTFHAIRRSRRQRAWRALHGAFSYFDTPERTNFYDKIDGIKARRKYRLRTYSSTLSANVRFSWKEPHRQSRL